ncbi:MAG TPA: hypothetical protein VFA82_01695 [Gaiellaceae bacterium]|nr:hypothetical protein [Gaiellaceae bacterium]
MKKLLVLAAAVAALATALPLAALADDGTAAVQADIAKLKTDVQTKHDTVVADAAKLQADAQSLVGTTDKKAARQTIKADAPKLTGDWKSLLATCLADRLQLRKDFQAAIQAGASKQDLRLLRRQANLEIRLVNLDMREAVAKAHLAVVELRQSFHQAGGQAPTVPTPPTTAPTVAPVTTS